jgi:uncharacterized protein
VIKPIFLLIISNVFMTFAWYGHLRDFRSSPLWVVIFVSWSVAFFEYCFQVPANRIGIQYFSFPQLKVLQEVITLLVFAFFSMFYMKVPLTRNYLLAAILLAGAAYLIFSEQRQ